MAWLVVFFPMDLWRRQGTNTFITAALRDLRWFLQNQGAAKTIICRGFLNMVGDIQGGFVPAYQWAQGWSPSFLLMCACIPTSALHIHIF